MFCWSVVLDSPKAAVDISYSSTLAEMKNEIMVAYFSLQYSRDMGLDCLTPHGSDTGVTFQVLYPALLKAWPT